MSLKTFKEILNECNSAESKQQTLFEKVYFKCNSKLLFEQVLKEMANYTKDMFIGAFEKALINITSGRDYKIDDDPEKTVREAISLIFNSNSVIYPFAIKYDDSSEQKGKIIVFEKYKQTIEDATKKRMETAYKNLNAAKTEKIRDNAKYQIEKAKETLSKIAIADESEIRNWITNTITDIKAQKYKNIIIDVFMIMYESLPTILTPKQVVIKLNNLQVLPHLGGSVISSR